MPRENRARAIAVSDNRFGAVFFTVLIVLTVCAALVGRARGDDFLDRVQALEARNAQAQADPAPLNRAPQPRLATPAPDHDTYDRHGKQPATPQSSVGKNYTHEYGVYSTAAVCDCGCIETGRCECKNCCSPTKTREAGERPTNKAAKAHCGCIGPGDCTCPPGSCDCAACKTAPKVGDTKVTDDPSRPWTYGYGREYGWNELGWYRPVATHRTSYQTVPVYYAPPPVFQGGFGGGFNGGGGGGSC